MEPLLILASASPQRRQLLEGVGIPFAVVPSAVHEDAHPEREPLKRSQTLARLKAEDVASRMTGGLHVLGCDTLVVAPDTSLLEKPADAGEAATMLRKQSGGVSVVHSAMCLLGPDGRCIERVSSSRVRFRALAQGDIDWWVGTRLWEGRSGGFQIDGQGQFLIEHIEGDWTGIVGLPVFLLGEMLREAGIWRMNNQQ